MSLEILYFSTTFVCKEGYANFSLLLSLLTFLPIAYSWSPPLADPLIL